MTTDASRRERPFLSVVVPVLNEEDNVGHLCDRLRSVLAAEASRFEVIFVDDGSTDATARRVADLHASDPSIRLVSLSRNFGHQIAITAGLDHVDGDACVTMDADLQHPPEVIPRLLAEYRKGFDVVSGVKTSQGRRFWVYRLGAAIYYPVMRRISNEAIEPHASDFRLMDRTVVDALRRTREATRFLRGLVKWVGFRSTSIPYEVGERHRGEPKFNFRRLAQLGAAGVFSFSVAPLRLATITGLLVAVFAGLMAVYYFVLKFREDVEPQGWTSLMVVILFLGGIQLLSIGMIGEYLGRVFVEAKRRPLYLVRETIGIRDGLGPPDGRER